VGQIVCPYHTDQKFPVFGFGGNVAGEVSHCFNLTFSSSPEVAGLEGIVGVYKHALTQVKLAGPTLFAPLLQATWA
jgi:hypothetical protein